MFTRTELFDKTCVIIESQNEETPEVRTFQGLNDSHPL